MDLCYLTAVFFSVELGPANSSSGPPPLPVLAENLWGLVEWVLYEPYVLPATNHQCQRTEHKALTLSSGLASSILHPPPDS